MEKSLGEDEEEALPGFSTGGVDMGNFQLVAFVEGLK